MIIPIDVYNVEEKEARKNLGYAQLSAANTKTFEEYGFPVVAETEADLIRYADFIICPDLPLRLKPGNYYRGATHQTDYTLAEVKLLTAISAGVGEMSRTVMGKEVRPHFNHLSEMGMFRMINGVSRAFGRENLSLFEVGPGCGYLSVLAGLLGYTYASYDVAQGLYLWQNRLLSHFFRDEFIDYADGKPLSAPLPRISHIPWWTFFELFRNCPFKSDVLLSNNNLGEMSHWSLCYVLRVAKLILAESDIGLVVFGSCGAEHQNSMETVENEFKVAGFKNIMNEPFHAYALADREFPEDVIANLKSDLPLVGDDGRGQYFSAEDFVQFDGDDFTPDYDFFSFLADWPDLRRTKNNET